MLAVAIIADMFSFIPVLNWFVTPVAALVLYMAGNKKDEVKLFSSEYIGGTLITIVIEFVLGFIPTWTIRVLMAQYAHKKMLRQQKAQGGTLKM